MTDDPGAPPDPPTPPPKRRRRPPPSLDGFDTGVPDDELYEASAPVAAADPTAPPPPALFEPLASVIVEAPAPSAAPPESTNLLGEAAPAPITDLPTVPSAATPALG
nr:hypothetical protein [Myxococcota bacterium]